MKVSSMVLCLLFPMSAEALVLQTPRLFPRHIRGSSTFGDADSETTPPSSRPIFDRRDALAFLSLGAAIGALPANALQDLEGVGDLGNAILKTPSKPEPAPATSPARSGGDGGGARAAPEPYTGEKKKMKVGSSS